MTAKEKFEKWWTVRLPRDEEQRMLATGSPGKFIAELAFLAGYKAGAQRSVELYAGHWSEEEAAKKIRKEFDL